MTPKPEECEVCGVCGHGLAREPHGAFDLQCAIEGYQRLQTELTVLRAQLEDAGRALARAEKERDEAKRETNRTFNTMQDELAEKIDCGQSGTEDACCDCVTCWVDRASDDEKRLAAAEAALAELRAEGQKEGT